MMFVFLPAFILALMAMAVLHFSRSRKILERWAERNGYRILQAQRRTFLRGPFFFYTAKGQEVFRVTVEDPQGQVRHGFVRCGSFWLGVLSDRADVRWDPAPPYQPGFPVVLPQRDDQRGPRDASP
jgi:hypothetical protein